jgi:hypothetical protein
MTTCKHQLWATATYFPAQSLKRHAKWQPGCASVVPTVLFFTCHTCSKTTCLLKNDHLMHWLQQTMRCQQHQLRGKSATSICSQGPQMCFQPAEQSSRRLTCAGHKTASASQHAALQGQVEVPVATVCRAAAGSLLLGGHAPTVTQVVHYRPCTSCAEHCIRAHALCDAAQRCCLLRVAECV